MFEPNSMVIFFLGIYFSITQATKELYDYPVIGIDLGMTYSSVCIQRNDKVEIIPNNYGSKTTPTVIAFSNDKFLVGEDAKEQAIINPQNTFYDLKRLTGRGYYDPIVSKIKKSLTYTITQENAKICIKVAQYRNESNKLFNIDKIQAKVLTKLKNIASSYLGVPIKHAVITVPIGFNDFQKLATKDIAEIAGLNVVRIISEPRAVAIAYGRDYVTEETNIFVFDFQCGTLDITAMKATKYKFEDLEHSQLVNLGGEDFDFNIVNYFIKYINETTSIDLSHNNKAIQVLKTEAQRAKEILSSQEIAHIRISNLIEGYDFNYSLTREKFEQLNEKLFQSVISVIYSTIAVNNLQIKDIDEVILVGGTSRIPKVQQIIDAIFVNSKIIKDRLQDELVCIGAAIIANSLTKYQNKHYQFVEIMKTSISYGVETYGGIMNIIIPKLSKYPLTLSRLYTTVQDYQSQILIKVFQGENQFTEFNYEIGNFKLSGIQEAKKGIPDIQITFALNQNGILIATALDLKTKSSNQYEIDIKNLMRQTDKNEKEKKYIQESSVVINMLKLYYQEFLIQLQKSKYKNQISQDELSKIKLLLDSSSKWLQENEHKTETTINDFEKELEDLTISINCIIDQKRDL